MRLESITSAYLVCKSNKLALWAFAFLSPTQSSAIMVRKLLCKESKAGSPNQANNLKIFDSNNPDQPLIQFCN